MLGKWLKLAPDWLSTTVFRIGSRIDPSIRRRTSLAMCHVAQQIPAAGLPAGYSINTLGGPSAPAVWLETLESAGIRVTPDTWTTELSDPSAYVAVVVYEGVVAGTASLVRIKNASSAAGLVTWVGVRQEHQGKSLGRHLIAACLGQARAAGIDTVLLVTDDHRLPAIRTYLRMGFRPCLNSWDWTHRARWRLVQSSLASGVIPCEDPAHEALVAGIG